MPTLDGAAHWGRLYDFIDTHDTCPIFPFPASNPRLGDTSAEEYLTEREDTWSVDTRNIVYADEGDPLDLYRTILRLDDLRQPVFAETGGSMLILSPLGSKVMALGALMAALESDLPVAHVESLGYDLEASVPEQIDQPDLIHGTWLPPFRAITADAAERVRPALVGASVFFLDRLSRGILVLAAEASDHGALVVFEPSGKSTDKLMTEALALAHVVKYADHRLAGIGGVMASGSAALLEVQTLGDQGLRYRHRLRRDVSRWMHLESVPAPRLADTCGAGDWCTAGLIAKTAVGGRKGFRRAGARGVRDALRYGQALAAWNCGFEGARGGMYAVSRQAFKRQITSLIDGRLDGIQSFPIGNTPTPVVSCPACPPAPSHSRQVIGGRPERAAR